jgi:hypothetical protein
VQTWEYLQIHVESPKGGMLASVYGKGAADKKEFRDLADLMGYLNTRRRRVGDGERRSE